MPRPIIAQVSAAPNFAFNLDEARAFFLDQDADSAASRFAKLKEELREMKALLSWSPACGRPAWFLNARSAQARFRLNTILEMARQAGLPSLREYVAARHVVLYAHADAEVILLALKHQRQLTYSTPH